MKKLIILFVMIIGFMFYIITPTYAYSDFELSLDIEDDNISYVDYHLYDTHHIVRTSKMNLELDDTFIWLVDDRNTLEDILLTTANAGISESNGIALFNGNTLVKFLSFQNVYKNYQLDDTLEKATIIYNIVENNEEIDHGDITSIQFYFYYNSNDVYGNDFMQYTLDENMTFFTNGQMVEMFSNMLNVKSYDDGVYDGKITYAQQIVPLIHLNGWDWYLENYSHYIGYHKGTTDITSKSYDLGATDAGYGFSFLGLFSAAGMLLNIIFTTEIFKGVTIGLFVLIPLLFALLGLFLRLRKGG